jgi:hypothetical protein
MGPGGCRRGDARHHRRASGLTRGERPSHPHRERTRTRVPGRIMLPMTAGRSIAVTLRRSRLPAKVTVCAAVIVLSCLASVAEAHTLGVTRTDPSGDAVADVLRTRRALVHGGQGRHRVRFAARVDFPSFWRIKVFVDSSGSTRGDFVLFASKVVGDPQCDARSLRTGRRIPVICDPGVSDASKLWWSVRRGRLHPDKPIRWRILTFDPGAPTTDQRDDRAPDSGWYP